jgi:isochorismate pyruvate lyase
VNESPGSSPCTTLDEVRARIDAIDERIVALLAERSGFVAQAARFKRTDAEAKAPARVERVIARVRSLADANAVDPDLIEHVYRAMIDWFVESELRELRSRSTRS